MNKINFKLEKNNDIIIKEDNINCINQNNKITFIINDIKYIYDNNIFTRETKEEIISLDLINNNCLINLKKEKLDLNLKIQVIENKKQDNIISIKYKIETEENIVNIITIEYV